ncbi:protein N-lysine methyltransferase METTL21A-like [Branchiostoma floridae x Branchiostoma japonicum]
MLSDDLGDKLGSWTEISELATTKPEEGNLGRTKATRKLKANDKNVTKQKKMRDRSELVPYTFAGKKLSIREIQVSMDEEVGYKVWHAGEAFCEYLEGGKLDLVDKTILELGAGTGIVGIVASLMGADVTLTDLKEVLWNLEENVRRNTEGCRHTPKVLELTWGRGLDRFSDKSYDFIIGTDIIYFEELHRDLIFTIKQLCRPHTRVLLCHYPRWPSRDKRFLELLQKDFVIVDQCKFLTARLFEAKRISKR